MEITINGNPYWVDLESWQMEQDWTDLPREAFYKKYPEQKPVYPPTRVTLDEADKKK